jgi:hypothetical protein
MDGACSLFWEKIGTLQVVGRKARQKDTTRKTKK